MRYRSVCPNWPATTIMACFRAGLQFTTRCLRGYVSRHPSVTTGPQKPPDMPSIEQAAPANAAPGFPEFLRTFFKIGCLGFGGPAGQIALMHRVLVDEKKWIEESRFLHALNFCMLLPGPEAQQLATYTGWL